MKRALLLTTIGVLFCVAFTRAQNVFNPADPIIRYNSGAALGSAERPNPAIWGLQKWVSVASSGVSSGSNSFDASSFKAYFMNLNGNQICFRLKFPKSYSNPDSAGKKYPTMIFFHGAGEPGCPSNGGVYNNERQLLHGGKLFRDRVDNGQFDGFLLYPQVLAGNNCWSDWGAIGFGPYPTVITIIDSLAKYARGDVDKVVVTGLSNGGAAAWNMAAGYPQRVTKAAPSAAATGSSNYSDFVHIPIWFATGGKDTNPTPGFASSTYNGVKNAGADITWTLYPDLGHSVWGVHWNEAAFPAWMANLHKANPLVFFQRNDFCPDSVINTKIGITGGFYAYEWQKDGQPLASRENGVNTIHNPAVVTAYTGNDVTVNSFGVYRVRFKRTATSEWSVFSPSPAVIYSKPVTATPTIQVVGLHSTVLPAPDGSTTVPLTLPAGFFAYQWYRNDTLVGTQQTYTGIAGVYKAKAFEQFGCGSQFSPLFNVVKANGSPKPEAAKNLTATATSLSTIQVDWSENPNAGENETGFEVYRSSTSGGPYTLLAITAPNVVTYQNAGLTPDTRYYYIVRAVGNYGAAALSNEATALTGEDLLPPSPPANFQVLATATNYAFLKWDASTDNVGVDKYDVYANGVKVYTTTATTFTVPNLDSNTVYTFYVTARDIAGNNSSPSNQVTASTIFIDNGINYKHYNGTWSFVPNFSNLTPASAGFENNISAPAANNYGRLWEGYIKVPTTATYTFRLCSDAGSKLYIGKPYDFNSTELINNDGVHTSNCVNGTIFLSAGVHPIAIPYFETSSSESLSLQWSNNAGLAQQNVPNINLFRRYSITGGTAPAPPSALVATAISPVKINLTWVDSSNNETGFEIMRSTSANGTYVPVATVAGTSYTDSGLTANTKYYYRIRSVGAYGESAWEYSFRESNWQVNSALTDALNGNRGLSNNGTTFNTGDKKEGSASLAFSGSNQYVTISNSSSGGFPSDGGYSQRTVALWIKPTSTNNRRIVFDFGNNANGLGLWFNGNALQAGVASGSSRVRISLANFTSDANWLAGNWNHVAVVYNQNSLRLFLNGVQKAATTTLPFTSVVAAASNNARFGYSGNSDGDNVFDSTSTDYYNGLMDDIHVINGALTNGELQAYITTGIFRESADTTLVAPAPPANPSSLNLVVGSVSAINLTWNDNSPDETGFEIWRSVGNDVNFRLLATVPGGAGATKNYSDTGLFANVTYYYRVRAAGLGGFSGYTGNQHATTLNSKPEISPIQDVTMRHSTSFALPISAFDPDGDALTFTAFNLPYFASIQPVSNGNANIVFNPTIGDQGAFTITLYVSDGFGGKDTTHYTMVINENAVPAMNVINNVSLNEGDTLKVALQANDIDGNNYMQWTFKNLPSFATFIDSGMGRGALVFKPLYVAAGDYIIEAIVDDGFGAWTSRSFSVTVTEKDPNQTVKINFRQYTGNVPQWNDVDVNGATFNVGNLLDTKGNVTPIGINFVSGSYGGAHEGAQTGNNSGVFPDAVMLDQMQWGFWGGNDVVNIRIRGLEPGRKYNLVFFGSSTNAGSGLNANSVTTYTVGAQSAQVHIFNNTTETDTIYQAQPNASGELFVTMTGDQTSGNAGGVLNALIVAQQFDDGSTPAKPVNLDAQIIPNSGIRLTWEDHAFNEMAYRVYRATNAAGPYTLINPAGGNQDSTGYTDLSVNSYTQYYYYVAGINAYGIGQSSDTVGITTGNNKPVITQLGNLFVKTDANAQDDFTVTDNAGDVVTVTIPNKPPFITLQSLGGNTYRIMAAPSINNIGWYALQVTATDNNGGVTVQEVFVTVADKNTRSVFINPGFNSPAQAPWNNMQGYGNAGTTMSNLVDETGAVTPFSVQLVNGWAGISEIGHTTGNNSGVFPDAVLRSSIWDNSGTARQVRFAGLNNAMKYNLVFVGSQNEGLDASARYVAGVVSDTLNARNNTNLTANLNGLTPVGGVITVDMSRLPGATYLFLNGIQIEEYSPAVTMLNPLNLKVEGTTDRTSALITWSDRNNNEDASGGFQLVRATDSLFSLNVTTYNLANNTTSFINTGLTPNTKYWYRVRSKVGGVFTDWSNLGKVITPQSIVYVNFNFSVDDAGFPWNNIGSLPNFTGTFSNFINQSGQPSGVSLSIERIFNGEYAYGIRTGNNSGVVPDNVLQSSYWLDNSQLSQVRLSGLNQSKRYRIGFTGSVDNQLFGGVMITTYTINGRTVALNAMWNTTKMVWIGDVVPDANGDVLIDFSTPLQTVYGFTSGIVIEAYTDDIGGTITNGVPAIPGSGSDVLDVTLVDGKETTPAISLQQAGIEGRMYPNPFTDLINLDFNNTSASNSVSVDVYDLTGRLVFKRNFGKLPEGYNTLRLNTAASSMGTGVYMVTLNVNGKPVQATKMIKTKQ
jgi:fibronectin type 3 domain-containing protein/predicted esterase